MASENSETGTKVKCEDTESVEDNKPTGSTKKKSRSKDGRRRTKTGCLSEYLYWIPSTCWHNTACRQRRVKCDEAKPVSSRRLLMILGLTESRHAAIVTRVVEIVLAINLWSFDIHHNFQNSPSNNAWFNFLLALQCHSVGVVIMSCKVNTSILHKIICNNISFINQHLNILKVTSTGPGCLNSIITLRAVIGHQARTHTVR